MAEALARHRFETRGVNEWVRSWDQLHITVQRHYRQRAKHELEELLPIILPHLKEYIS